MIRVFALFLCCLSLSGCGKKPNILLPPTGDTRTDPAIYPYPMVQPAPPPPSSAPAP